MKTLGKHVKAFYTFKEKLSLLLSTCRTKSGKVQENNDDVFNCQATTIVDTRDFYIANKLLLNFKVFPATFTAPSEGGKVSKR